MDGYKTSKEKTNKVRSKKVDGILSQRLHRWLSLTSNDSFYTLILRSVAWVRIERLLLSWRLFTWLSIASAVDLARGLLLGTFPGVGCSLGRWCPFPGGSLEVEKEPRVPVAPTDKSWTMMVSTPLLTWLVAAHCWLEGTAPKGPTPLHSNPRLWLADDMSRVCPFPFPFR